MVRMKNEGKTLLVASIAASISLVFYLRTLCPTVYGGDSGELTTVAYTLGIAHPPGYPLYTLVGRLILFVPLASPAMIMNLFSAFCASLSVFCLFFIIYDLIAKNSTQTKQHLVMAFLGSLIWGFSRTIWNNANAAEVYSLGMALFSAAVLVFLLADKLKKPNLVLLGFYIIGLSLTNHMTAISLLPIGIAAGLWFRFDLRRWLLAAFALLIPLTLYLYIPIRSANWPIIDWAHPARFEEFINHITSARFRGYLADLSLVNFFVNMRRFLELIPLEFPLALIGLGGLLLMAAKSPRIGIPITLAAMANIGFATMYEIHDIEPHYLVTIVSAVIGICYFVSELAGLVRKALAINYIKVVPSLILAAILAIGIKNNYPVCDKSRNLLAANYGREILNSIPQNALFVPVGGAASLVCVYFKLVEKIRPDIEYYDPISMYSTLARKTGREHLIGIMPEAELALVALAESRKQSFLGKEYLWGGDNPFRYDQYPLQGYGLCFRYGHREKADMTPWGKLAGIADLAPSVIGTPEIQILANFYLAWGEDLQSNNLMTEARKKYETAVRYANELDIPMLDNSLGIFFRRHGIPDMALERYNRALKSDALSNAIKADIFVNTGNLYRDERKYDKAIESYKEAMALKRDHREAAYNLAIVEAYDDLEKGKYAGAINKFKSAWEIDPADPGIIYNIAVIYDKYILDTAQAIQHYMQYLKISPEGKISNSVARRLNELSGKN